MRRLTIAGAVLLVAVSLAPAATSKLPGWLLFEQGKAWAGQGEYGKALQCFKDAILDAGVMPEADAAIADVYRAEGEFQLAERHYQRAYNLRNALVVPAEKYDILLRWAGLYEDQEMYSQMEAKLFLVIADDRWSQGEQLAIQVERNYVDKGLDHVLALYRFDSAFATSAHSRLGWFYYRTGRYPQALHHLLYAVILQVSEGAEFLKQRDAEAVVTRLAGFFEAAASDRDLRVWLDASTLSQDLYYLSAAAWELGHPTRARDVWKILSSREEAGKFADLSKRQLAKPFREPFLTTEFKLPTSP
jgi:tetratricopeptide (TPR) repeat protein